LAPKNYSAQDGIGGTIGFFRRNSGCSAELKILGIPFRTIPKKRKMLGIPYRGTKIEAKGGIPFQTIPQKRKQLGRTRNPDPARNRSLGSSVPHNKTRPPQILKIEPEKTTFVCSGKLILPGIPFRSELRNGLFRGIRNTLGMSTFFHGITESIPSIFRRIFS
jgi:hypothetical protein